MCLQSMCMHRKLNLQLLLSISNYCVLYNIHVHATPSTSLLPKLHLKHTEKVGRVEPGNEATPSSVTCSDSVMDVYIVHTTMYMYMYMPCWCEGCALAQYTCLYECGLFTSLVVSFPTILDVLLSDDSNVQYMYNVRTCMSYSVMMYSIR